MSNVVTIDTTPPVFGIVSDSFATDDATEVAMVGGDAASSMAVRWSVFDPESGIMETDVCLGSFPGACDTLLPTSVLPTDTKALYAIPSPIDGVFYYATVFARNAAGEQSRKSSNGFRRPPVVAAHCSLLTSIFLLRIACSYCVLLTSWWVLLAAYCLLPSTDPSLFSAGCVRPIAILRRGQAYYCGVRPIAA